MSVSRPLLIGLSLLTGSSIGCDGPWQFGVAPVALRNATEYPQAIALRRHVGVFECDWAADPDIVLDEEDFEPIVLEQLPSGATVGLTVERADATAERWRCGTAHLATQLGQRELRIAWDLRDVDLENTPTVPEPGLVYVERFGGSLRANPGPGMFVFDAFDRAGQ